MIAFSIGILVKVLVNTPLLHLFGGHGAVLGTILGYLVSNVIMLYCIIKFAKFKMGETAKQYSLLRFTLGNVCCCNCIKSNFKMVNPWTILYRITAYCIYMWRCRRVVYLLFVLTSGLASHILGDRIQRLPILGS